MSTNLIRNYEVKQPTPVKTGLEYRVDARTERERRAGAARVWPDKPTYSQWRKTRKPGEDSRAAYAAVMAETISTKTQERFYELLRNVNDLLRKRIEIDKAYGEALNALAAFGPIHPDLERDLSEPVRAALKLRKQGLRPEREDAL